MANHLADGSDRPPALPPVAVPDHEELRVLAGRSQVVHQLRQIAEWAGRGRTLTVPTFADLLDETAEVVVATAADAGPDAGAALMRAWKDHNPATASADLHALADRTDDRAHRRIAREYAKSA
jgi:hypothetical protein